MIFVETVAMNSESAASAGISEKTSDKNVFDLLAECRKKKLFTNEF